MSSHTTALRSAVKRIVYPCVPERFYRQLQAMSMASDIRRGRFYEPELDLVPHAAQAGDTALDIGANFGLYSYHMDRAVAPGGKVYAFEPVPFTHETLRQVARKLRFRQVDIVPKGCSDRAGTIQFTVPLQASGGFMAGQAHIAGRRDDRPGSDTQVRWKATRAVSSEVIVLDEILPELPHLSLIKCDVEGAELPVFRGAARLIEQSHPTVICEINPWYMEGFGLSLDELLQFFRQRGYGLYRYRGERGRGILAPVSAAEVVEDNFVFVHPDRRARLTGILA